MARLAVGLLFVAAAVLALGGIYVFTPTPAANSPLPPPTGGARDSFAADRDPGPSDPVPFDGKAAMTYLETICKIGPRISGTEGMKHQQDLLQKHFEARGGKVRFQRFTASQHSRPGRTDMANIIVSWYPERTRRVILCSHYDTRPIADQEPNRRRWHDPFLSANDGGSGVALLMELANHVKEMKTSVGIDFVLFDGEEYIFDPEHDKYFFGSEYFANAYTQNHEGYSYVAAVLLDMIGGKNLQLPAEQNSIQKARRLVEEIWKIAGEQKCEAFQNQVGPSILDDHLALLQADIPAVDLIDFNYPHWHRLSDIPASCSGESMAAVARVLSVWLQRAR